VRIGFLRTVVGTDRDHFGAVEGLGDVRQSGVSALGHDAHCEVTIGDRAGEATVRVANVFLRSPQDHVRRVLKVTGLDVMLLDRATTNGPSAR